MRFATECEITIDVPWSDRVIAPLPVDVHVEGWWSYAPPTNVTPPITDCEMWLTDEPEALYRAVMEFVAGFEDDGPTPAISPNDLWHRCAEYVETQMEIPLEFPVYGE